MEVKLKVKYHHKEESEEKRRISFCDALGNNAITVGKCDNTCIFVSTGVVGDEKAIIMQNEDAKELAEFILSIL